MSRALLALACTTLLACEHDPLPGGGSATFRAEPFLGEWIGTWTNLTANTTGPASFLVSAPAGDTLAIVVDLGGDVFGAGDPPAQEFVLGIGTNAAILAPQTSPTFGRIEGRLEGDGTMTATLRDVPIGDVREANLVGVWGPGAIDLEATLRYREGSATPEATATLRLTRI